MGAANAVHQKYHRLSPRMDARERRRHCLLELIGPCGIGSVAIQLLPGVRQTPFENTP
jgi:hypothetical protein